MNNFDCKFALLALALSQFNRCIIKCEMKKIACENKKKCCEDVCDDCAKIIPHRNFCKWC